MSTADAPIPKAPQIKGAPPHVLIVRAPYYKEIVDNLTTGARAILTESGASVETLDVAGAYELPQAIRLAIRGSRRYDGFVALGCIIRGETDHYEFISKSTMDGLMNVALQFGICLGTGLLTCDNKAQAEARATLDGFNKGSEAAVAAVTQLIAAQHFGAI
jgi:6,7-dimethyl-8-ribityllumazine synthase